MGINKQSQISANLQIGPTSEGMVRIYVEGNNIDLPLDFEPEEANDICLLYTSPSPRDVEESRMPSSA